jgi:hypothetical protein
MNHQQVCHEWASQNKASRKGHNIFFEGPSIYSYGRHFEIARFVRPDVVLFNSASYSVSTSKHQSYTRHAIGAHIRVYTVPQFTYHPDNLKYFFEHARESMLKAGRARTYKDMLIREAESYIQDAICYSETFAKELPFKKLDKATATDLKKARAGTFFNAKDLEALRLEAKESAKKQAAAEKLKKAKRIQEEADDLEAWKAGTYPNYRHFSTTALRIKDNEVQTSHGATVPVLEARKLYRAMKHGLNVIGQRVGLFEVQEITPEYITIGCHVIPIAEIERIAPEVMAWKAPAPTVCEDCLGIDGHEANCATHANTRG